MERHPIFMDSSFNIVKISLLSKPIYIFNAAAINIDDFSQKLKKKLIIKHIWNLKVNLITKKKKKKNPEKGQSQRNHTPNFKAHYKATVIK